MSFENFDTFSKLSILGSIQQLTLLTMCLRARASQCICYGPIRNPARFEAGRPASKQASSIHDRSKITARFELGWLDSFEAGRPASKQAGWTALNPADHSLDGFETRQRLRNRLDGPL